MQHLATIFDSSARVKLMRWFLYHDHVSFDIKALSLHTHAPTAVIRKEIALLTRVGFLKSKTSTQTIPSASSLKKNSGKTSTLKNKDKKKKGKGVSSQKKSLVRTCTTTQWSLNNNFSLLEPLRALVVESELVHTKTLPQRFAEAGTIKLLVLSGIFMKNKEQNVDILIVGDKLHMKKLDTILHALEAEIGKELRYAIFTPDEFQYRLQMYDQHLLEVFQAPHDRVVDKLGIQI
jgi:hypothetical protein